MKKPVVSVRQESDQGLNKFNFRPDGGRIIFLYNVRETLRSRGCENVKRKKKILGKG